MCKVHGKRTWLNVPQWLHDEWKNGSKDAMADCLRDCNFDKDTILNILISFGKVVWKANHMQQMISIIYIKGIGYIQRWVIHIQKLYLTVNPKYSPEYIVNISYKGEVHEHHVHDRHQETDDESQARGGMVFRA